MRAGDDLAGDHHHKRAPPVPPYVRPRLTKPPHELLALSAGPRPLVGSTPDGKIPAIPGPKGEAGKGDPPPVEESPSGGGGEDRSRASDGHERERERVKT